MKKKKSAVRLFCVVGFLVLTLPVCNDAGSTHCFGAGCASGRALPDSGRIVSYTTTFGEDSDYQPASTMLSYTINADNTVTDNRTALVWRRCSQGQTDNASCSGTAGTYTWEQALTQCEGETTDYSDWRLPNIKELLTLLKYDYDEPYIEQSTFPATISGAYWTGTTYEPNSDEALVVNFYGVAYDDYKTEPLYVRCVRAGP